MTTVGIRELKAHLSTYVRAAAAGETIVVTDRGRPVATLRGSTASPVDALVAEGLTTPPTRRDRHLPAPVRGAGTVSDLVGDQRR